MQKNFDHTQQESHIYELWEKAEAFKPKKKQDDQMWNQDLKDKTQILDLDSTNRVKDDGMSKSTKQPTNQATNQPFSIIMPPPNANDPLHVGHAMFISIEDIMIRYHRMKGDETVWIPGTDHAGIETQFVFEKKLAKQGKSRFNFDRETLYNMIWEYVQENSGVAVDQMKKLGASADWSRFKFTLDPLVVEFVTTTFKRLHDDGLVYRDLKLVNYCTHCGTSYSELEVNHTEQTTNLYYVRYPFADNPSEYIVVATTRPEPIFADQYLAVHPEDESKKHLIGKKVLNPLTKQPMEIIADSFVDPEFGTGIVKLTPAHDFNDFEVAQRHNLPLIIAIGIDGKIVKDADAQIKSDKGNTLQIAGVKVAEARKQVVEFLEQEGLIEKINSSYQNRIGSCYRCGRVIEILPLPQFFIKVKDEKNNLTQRVLDVLDKGETKVYGAGREKILRNWLENLKDWNISRQIVWGIRIPVWYSIKENPEIEVSYLDEQAQLHRAKISELNDNQMEQVKKGLQQLRAPSEAPFVVSVTSPGNDYLQETDTFDTWFSSGQWPVVTLRTSSSKGSVASSKQGNFSQITNHQSLTTNSDFERFYPTSVMETGYDILPFWVMRMMMLGIYLEGKTPFKHVYLHGLVRDEKGQKMSKSKGNVINPIEFVNKYGADAVRMALVMSSTPGNDSAIGENKIRGMRNFSNKIWNATRFVLTNLETPNNKSQISKENSSLPMGENAERSAASEGNAQQIARPTEQEKLQCEKDFHDSLATSIQTMTERLENLKIGQAAEWIYDWFWHVYCDDYIEKFKKGLLSRESLIKGLIVNLKLLHPFAPYVTETVWQELWNTGDEDLRKEMVSELLISAEWPEVS